MLGLVEKTSKKGRKMISSARQLARRVVRQKTSSSALSPCRNLHLLNLSSFTTDEALLTSVHRLRLHPVRVHSSSSSSLSPLDISVPSRPTHQPFLPSLPVGPSSVQLHLTSIPRRVVPRSSSGRSTHVGSQPRVRSTRVDLCDAGSSSSSLTMGRLVLRRS